MCHASFGEFAARIVEDMALPYDAAEFLRRFDAWPVAIYPGVTELLQQLAVRYRCALLSNTNALHWGREDISAVLAPRFNKLFLSFETGILKPDRAAFEQVIEYYACRPQEILFFDDTPSNVAAAEDIGIQAQLIAGDNALRHTLSALGIS